MCEETNWRNSDETSEFDYHSPESSGEYVYKISDEALKTWKITFEAEGDSSQQIPTRKQKTLSWCGINAYSEETIVSDPEKGNSKLSSLFKCKQTEVYQKQILKDVNGIAYPGELLVIMGSSGAGKTTLLNCMTFRNLKNLTVSGLVCVNNEPVTQKELAGQSAYVQQDDLFIVYLTVKEHLIFQSLLRMDSYYTYRERLDRIEEVMRELALKKCENCIIGQPGVLKGISGGERKRLALASELLINPSLLFCDEPTTGLDSFMSLNVFQILRDISKTGRTVIITLHQPSSELFHMFDKLCLMAEGRTAFLGTTAEARTFFTKLQAPCPKKFNPADHYIQLLSILPGREVICKRAVNSICDAFNTSSLGVRIKKITEDIVKSAREKGDPWSRKRGHINPYRVGWFRQIMALFWRSWLSIIKNPNITKKKLFMVLMESALITIIYFGQTLNQVGVQNLNGVFFYLLMSTSFQNVFGVIHIFCDEIPLFLKEHKDGMYRTDVYYLSKIICAMPFSMLFACLNTGVLYYFVGLNPEFYRFLTALFISILLGQAAQGGGYIVSTVAPNIQVTFPLVGILIVPLFIFCGFFISLGSIPWYFMWLSELSWFKYAFQAYLINQWDDISYIQCHKNFTDPSICINDGLEVLQFKSIQVGEFWPAIGALIALAVFFRIIGFLILLGKASFKE